MFAKAKNSVCWVEDKILVRLVSKFANSEMVAGTLLYYPMHVCVLILRFRPVRGASNVA